MLNYQRVESQLCLIEISMIVIGVIGILICLIRLNGFEPTSGVKLLKDITGSRELRCVGHEVAA